jgi:chromosome segregation ATPase
MDEEHDILQKNLDNLKKDYDILQMLYKNVREDIDNKQKLLDNLKEDHDKLKTLYDNTKEDYDKLQIIHDNLKKEFDILDDKQKNLLQSKAYSAKQGEVFKMVEARLRPFGYDRHKKRVMKRVQITTMTLLQAEEKMYSDVKKMLGLSTVQLSRFLSLYYRSGLFVRVRRKTKNAIALTDAGKKFKQEIEEMVRGK